jgi:hypothetical protein
MTASVTSSGDARQERHRHEDRAEHERDRHDRSGDFLHRLMRGGERRQTRGDIALDVLYHDDRMSTTMPIARTSPKRLSVLIENPYDRYQSLP